MDKYLARILCYEETYLDSERFAHSSSLCFSVIEWQPQELTIIYYPASRPILWVLSRNKFSTRHYSTLNILS